MNLSYGLYYIVLAQRKYFEDESFMNFLKYLRYWKQTGYIEHLVFPQCLTILDAIIDNEEFKIVSIYLIIVRVTSLLIYWTSLYDILVVLYIFIFIEIII